MTSPIYQVDAFTRSRFAGNPAAVMPLDAFLPDATLQAIAAENNLAETAFIVADRGEYRLRWFTPTDEVPLCGHATLASAAVVMERLEPERTNVVFMSESGALRVERHADRYVMDFPSHGSERIEPPAGFAAALGATPGDVFANAFNFLAVFDSADVLHALSPDMPAIAKLDRPGVIVTAPGCGRYDFVSRYFAPGKGIPEDPVTGSAHCMLAPFWSQRLGKSAFLAFQDSKRGGEVACRLVGDRVELEGSCVFYLEGHVEI